MTTIDDLTKWFFKITTHPTKSQFDRLLAMDIPVMALAHDGDGEGWAAGVAKIEKCGRRFELVEDGSNAVVVIARDEDGEPADLVAWLPNEGWFGLLFDAVPLLGMHDLLAPRLAEPLAVFLSPLDWLRAGRVGVVVLDRKRAWRALEGVTVAAGSLEDGEKLRRILEPPKPKIVIANSHVDRIAA